MTSIRTHHCAALTASDADSKVRLCGWIDASRDLGKFTFISLRDWCGTTQIVLEPGEIPDDVMEAARAYRLESVIRVDGTVRARPPKDVNSDMPTGEIEVVANRVEPLSLVMEALPFPVQDQLSTGEENRLRHRFLDLRRPRMSNMLRQRARFCQLIRERFANRGFLEVATPILSNSSPEGARDFVIPSRLHPGRFFALPQAPQQWKQMLIAAGVDRYFQIAPCFRDEPARADRTPGEFYQVDVEMAFVEQEDVLTEVESLLTEIGREFCDKRIISPFPRLDYRDVLNRYGSDKPDVRVSLELVSLTDFFKESSVRVLREVVESGDVVRSIPVPDGARYSRRQIDELRGIATDHGATGLAWLAWKGDQVRGSLAGPMDGAEASRLRERVRVEDNGLLLLASGGLSTVNTALNAVRNRLGDWSGERDPDTLAFSWILDFPIYEADPDTGEIIFSHNPFSMPKGGVRSFEEVPPLEILGQQYDLTCNGIEISSGAIRNNDPEGLYRAFEIAGYRRADVDASFGHMIRAFRLGSPPHGGIAPGLERLLMFFLGETSIREVIPFPKNQRCQDTMIGAPSELSNMQLEELRIAIKQPLQ